MENGILFNGMTMEDFWSKARQIIREELTSRDTTQPVAEIVYITRKEVAKKLRLSLPTISELTKSGKLPGYRIGRRVLFKSNEVELALSEIQASKYKPANKLLKK